MDINITHFFNNADAHNYFASQLEMGADAGKITWNNAKEHASHSPLLTTDKQFDEFRDWIAGYGDWEDDEIAAWDADECNALLIQFISGDIRELELAMNDDGEIDWDEAEELSQQGTIAGNIYPGNDGQIYFYMGS